MVTVLFTSVISTILNSTSNWFVPTPAQNLGRPWLHDIDRCIFPTAVSNFSHLRSTELSFLHDGASQSVSAATGDFPRAWSWMEARNLAASISIPFSHGLSALKRLSPQAKARFGSVCERLFGAFVVDNKSAVLWRSPLCGAETGAPRQTLVPLRLSTT